MKLKIFILLILLVIPGNVFSDGYWTGGHCNTGITQPATIWYLAEGSTLGCFDMWVCIQNIEQSYANCKVTFMNNTGVLRVIEITIPPTSRYTIHANEYIPSDSISTKVESTNGAQIIVERAMYWDANGERWIGGHCSSGVSEPSKNWYLAEGTTVNGFDEWVCILNPSANYARVLVTFSTDDQRNIVQEIQINPESRYTIHVNQIVPETSLATRIESTEPIVVERAMYWSSCDLKSSYTWKPIFGASGNFWGFASTSDGRLLLGRSYIGDRGNLDVWRSEPKGCTIEFWKNFGWGETINSIISKGNEVFIQIEGHEFGKIYCLSGGWDYEFPKIWCLGTCLNRAQYTGISGYAQKAELWEKCGDSYMYVSTIPEKSIIWEITEFNGAIYCACSSSQRYKEINCGSVWKYDGSWNKVLENVGLCKNIKVFNGKLWVATGWGTESIYCSTTGDNWDPVLYFGSNVETFLSVVETSLYAGACGGYVAKQGIDGVRVGKLLTDGWHTIFEVGYYNQCDKVVGRDGKLYILVNRYGASAAVYEGN